MYSYPSPPAIHWIILIVECSVHSYEIYRDQGSLFLRGLLQIPKSQYVIDISYYSGTNHKTNSSSLTMHILYYTRIPPSISYLSLRLTHKTNPWLHLTLTMILPSASYLLYTYYIYIYNIYIYIIIAIVAVAQPPFYSYTATYSSRADVVPDL